MATTANILALLNFYSSKQNNAFINFNDFADYLRRYAEHHVEDQVELTPYLGDSIPALTLELEKYAESKQVVLLEPRPGKKEIYVVSYYIQQIANTYSNILKTPTIPFPVEGDMPKSTPKEILLRVDSSSYIFDNIAKSEAGQIDNTIQNKSDAVLYNLVLPHEEPPLLLPSSVPIMMVLDAAVFKLRGMLSKEEYHDYFLKKVTNSNPGKEMTAKNFFKAFVKSNEDAAAFMRLTEDYFYFWTQLCFFIRQDYGKVKEKTGEDVSILQSLSLLEIALTYMKDKTQQNEQKETAFKVLEISMKRPPFYYTFDAISKFTDGKDVPLLTYFTQDELKGYLQKLTTETVGSELPKLLMFKVENGTGYFIAKEKVMQVVVRLCSDSRTSVREAMKKHWHESLLNFETLPEMKNDKEFEKRLEREVKVMSPILYALLNTSFLQVVNYESFSTQQTSLADHIVLFTDGHLVPYSQILLMNRAEMLSDAKIMLPFWYSFPLISWFMKMLTKKPKNRKKVKKQKTDAELYREAEEKKRREEKEMAARVGNENVSKKVALHEAAREAENALVPAESTLDRELDAYRSQWNVLINKDAHNNLTEDVNALIRDYVRKVVRTLNVTSFTLERIRSIAETLVVSPGLQKIKDKDALNMYIQLQIIKLVKNLPT